jgi:hypothetical protein
MSKCVTPSTTSYEAVESAIALSKSTGTWEQLLVKSTVCRPWTSDVKETPNATQSTMPVDNSTSPS